MRLSTSGIGVFFVTATALMACVCGLALATAAPPTGPSYVERMLATDGLYAYWRLGEGSGTTALDAANGHHATYAGGPTLAVDGAVHGDSDTAARFDGIDDRASAPTLTSSTDFTVEGWQRIANSNANHALYARAGSLRVLGRPNGYYGSAWIGGTEYVLQGNSDTNLGVWRHWALVRRADKLTLYRDGEALASRTDLPTAGTTNLSADIGRYGSGYATVGEIDEVAVFTRALQDTEVRAHFDAGAPPPSQEPAPQAPYEKLVSSAASLVGYWRLGESSGTTAGDAHGTRDGTYLNGPGLGTDGALATDFDSAVSFDGVNDVVDLPALPSAAAFTIEGWQRITDTSTTNNTLYGGATGARLLPRPDGYFASVRFGSTDYSLQGTSISNVGQWVHWALVRDGAALRLVRNGEVIASREDLPTGPATLDGDIGRQGTSYPAESRIDEVAIYDTALSTQTLRSHRTAGTHYLPATGDRPEGSFQTFALDDMNRVRIDALTGSALVEADDIQLADTPIALEFDRTYNSLAGGRRSLGRNWTLALGKDVRLRKLSDGSVAYYGPTGETVLFARQAGGELKPPDSFHGSLKRGSGNTYTLHDLSTGQTLEFANGASLTRQSDNGNDIAYTYTTGETRLETLTHSTGETVTPSYNATGQIEHIATSAGRAAYEYDSSGNLTRATTPAGTTEYSYDDAEDLTRVEAPGGATVTLEYDSRHRVIRVIHDDASALGGQAVTTFTYSTAQTSVTRPDGTQAAFLTPTQAAEKVEEVFAPAVAPSAPSTVNGQDVEPSVEKRADRYAATGTLVDGSLDPDKPAAFELATDAGQLTISAPASQQATAGQVVNGDSLVYANAQDDVDMIARPTPEGVETFALIRSRAAADQALSYDLELPDDTELVEQTSGTVAIVDTAPTAAEPAGSKPSAVDAGTAVADALREERGVPESMADIVPGEEHQALAETQDKAGDPVPATSQPTQPPEESGLEIDPASGDKPSDETMPPEDQIPAAVDEMNQRAQDVPNEVRADAVTELQELQTETAAFDDEFDETTRTSADDVRQVAEVKEVWAKDANGEEVDTEIVLDGQSLDIVVQATEDTVFPVVVDPWIAVTTTTLKWVSEPVYKTVAYVKMAVQARHVGWMHIGWCWTPGWTCAPTGNGWWALPGGYFAALGSAWTWYPTYIFVNVPSYATKQVIVGWRPVQRWVTETTWRYVPTPDEMCRDAFVGDASGYRFFCQGQGHGDTNEGDDDEVTAHAAGYRPGDLKEAEKLICARYSYACPGWFKASREAIKFAGLLFTSDMAVSDNTRSNAFQHAFWSALAVKHAPPHLEQRSLQMVQAHESNPKGANRPPQWEWAETGPRRRSQMDYINNVRGWNLGRQSRGNSDRHICHTINDGVLQRADRIPFYADPFTWYQWSGRGQMIFRKWNDRSGRRVNPTGRSCEGAGW